MSSEDVELSFEDLTFGDARAKVDAHSSEESISTAPVSSQASQAPATPSAIPIEHCLLISSPYGSKFNFQIILKHAEDHCGKIKQSSYRDKQCFGFIAFVEESSCEKALELYNDVEVEGTLCYAERVKEITPGRDPRTHNVNSEYKNSTLVLKNLPFQLKQEKLEEMLAQYPFKPLNVSYLYDATGMFRGMAFVKFREIEQATKVFEQMNNLDINGRKLRIEYKRRVKEAGSIGETEDIGGLSEQLSKFQSSSLQELAFPCNSSYQRRELHQIAEKFGLGHYSTGEGESKYVLVKKRDPSQQHHEGGNGTSTSPHDKQQLPSTSPAGKEMWTEKNNAKQRRPSDVGRNPPHQRMGLSPQDRGYFASPSSYERQQQMSTSGGSRAMMSKSWREQNSFMPRSLPTNPSGSGSLYPPGTSPVVMNGQAGVTLGTSPSYRHSAAILVRHNVDASAAATPGTGAPSVQIARQPVGPNSIPNSNGFGAEYKNFRKLHQPLPMPHISSPLKPSTTVAASNGNGSASATNGPQNGAAHPPAKEESKPAPTPATAAAIVPAPAFAPVSTEKKDESSAAPAAAPAPTQA